MTPRERVGDFSQVAYQVAQEATKDDDATDSEDEPEADAADGSSPTTKKEATG